MADKKKARSQSSFLGKVSFEHKRFITSATVIFIGATAMDTSYGGVVKNFTDHKLNSINITSHVVPVSVIFGSPLTHWFIITLTMLLMASFITFLLLLAILMGQRSKVSGSKLLIIHAVAIDLAVCLIHAPLNTIATFKSHFPRSACAFIHFSFLSTIYAGQWTGAFLALNRLTATLIPHQYGTWTKKKIAICTIIVPWIAGIVLTFEPIFGIGANYQIIPPWFGCGMRPDGPIYTTTSATFGVYLPLGIVLGTYLAIFLKSGWETTIANRVAPLKERGNAAAPTNAFKRRLAVAKMLCASALWYCVCYFPNTVLITTFFDIYQRNPVMQLWLRTLFYCGYALNPPIFFAMSDEYRRGLSRVIRTILLRDKSASSGFRQRNTAATLTTNTGNDIQLGPMKATTST